MAKYLRTAPADAPNRERVERWIGELERASEIQSRSAAHQNVASPEKPAEAPIPSSGKNLVAVAYLDYLYTSADYGATWTQQGTQQTWVSVASSSDGTKLIAVAYPGYIYTWSSPVP